MAELRPNPVLYAPGGVGLAAALRQTVRPESIVTTLDDQLLRTAKLLLKQKFPDSEDRPEFRPFADVLGWISRMAALQTGRRLSPTQLTALIMRAAQNLSTESELGESRRLRGTAEAIAQTITTLHYHHYTDQDLTKAAPQAPGPLANKLRDLAFLESSVRELKTTINGEFAADRANRLLESNPENPFPVSHLVAIVGPNPAPLYEQTLAWLASQGIEVDILLEWASNDHSSLGTNSKRVLSLLSLVQPVKQPDTWVGNLFTPNPIDTAQRAPQARLIDLPDAFSEVETVLREAYSVYRSGVSWSKIGVFTRDPESYAPLIISAAKRFGIPVSLRLGIPLLSNGFASFVLRLFRALSQSDVRQLGPLLSSSYFALPQQEQERTNTLLQRASQSQDPWQALADILENEPGLEQLAIIAEWRLQVAAEPKTVKDWQAALVNFVAVVGTLDRLDNTIVSLERDQRAMTLMQRSVNEAHLRLGNDQITLPEFTQILHDQWNMERVAWNTVPYSDDAPEAVTVCTSTSQLQDFHTLFAVGLLEGVMPRRRSEDPIFSDQDIEFLNQSFPDKPQLPDSHSIAAAERDEFARLCGSAETSLVFTYPQTSDDKDNIPAFYLEELKRTLPSTPPVEKRAFQLAPPADQAILYTDQRLREALDSPPLTPAPPTLRTEQAKSLIRPDESTVFKPEWLGAALQCPFRATVKHRIRLFPPLHRTLLSILRYIPKQAGLVHQTDPITARQALLAQIKGEVDKLTPSLQPWEVQLLTKGAERLLENWLEHEFDARQKWPLDDPKVETPGIVGLDPEGFEWKVGETKIRIKPVVDAVLRTPETVVALKYDTSAPQFKPESFIQDHPEDAVAVGLTLLGLSKESPNSAVQVDSFETRRLYCLKNPFRNASYVRSKNLYVDNINPSPSLDDSQSRKAFFEELRKTVHQAVETLKQADSKPNPGEHCDGCLFSDLCRSHRDYGETTLPIREASE